MGNLASLCWEGLTLKHVSHPKIVKPYLVFVFTALLFELFLLVLFGVASFIFYTSSLRPDFLYYISGAILVIFLFITVLMIKTILFKIHS